MSSNSNPQLRMPGFNVDLNCTANRNIFGMGINGFRNGLDKDHHAFGCMYNLITHREILMMRVMDMITDEPGWDQKVFDEDITAEWRNKTFRLGQYVTPKMMDWIIKELQWKAGVFKEKGLVHVFDVGVIKSDTAVSKDLQQALKEAVKPLENIPEDQKDYHPGSDKKVVNLVNPSLFPVRYGQTHVLANRTIGLHDCLSSVGQGDLIPVPSRENCRPPNEYNERYSRIPEAEILVFSDKFQSLPCDVELTHDAGCRIVSYINNVHPVDHKGLYDVIEKIIACAIPLWDQSLTEFCSNRINYRNVTFSEHTQPEPTWPEKDNKDEQYEAEQRFWERNWQWQITRPILLPEPQEFTFPGQWRRVNIRNQFPKTKLQVIVKLANIELTTDNPEYEGGSWHLEGQLNERICATAIYYYDSENITEGTHGFRQHGMDNMINITYCRGQHQFLQAVYGFGDDVRGRGSTNVTQDLGGVVCQEGRLLTFPNTVQNRVSPFSLDDRSKPGHRKILALFLVDPHRRVISSANVPPQREDWGGERQQAVNQVLSRLPLELQYIVQSYMDPLMTMDEAKAHRLDLMKDHELKSERLNQNFETGNFRLS
ncbi:hypothetical protein PENPOL_c001G07677 [Penicillium polonicum]|uniref:Uncharacterized protein n=1 Tax=Penicillium polonicum TaxID=60169 RepID=A0A1V6P2C3_PENPO|nr:hypothetical protein PENPOL_c001G07677 [Penicillium polonicum]